MDKPDVDFIEGLSPAISIDQKSASRNPRSTVGTITEIYDYLRSALRAHRRRRTAPNCGRVITRQTPQQIVDRVLQLDRRHPVPGAGAGRAGPQGRVRGAAEGARVAGLHPRPGRRRAGRARRGQPASAWPGTRTTPSRSSSTGSCGARASSAASPTRWRPRCAWPRASPRSRSCPRRQASRGGDSRPSRSRSTWRARTAGVSFDELAPRNFSFNSPYGACERCDGLGTRFEVDPELVVPDDDLSLARRRDRAVVGVPQPLLRAGARLRRRRVRLLASTRRGRS